MTPRSNADLRPADPNECVLAADLGMRMVDNFDQRNGRRMPQDEIEFAGLLAIAFMLGRESLVGRLGAVVESGS